MAEKLLTVVGVARAAPEPGGGGRTLVAEVRNDTDQHVYTVGFNERMEAVSFELRPVAMWIRGGQRSDPITAAMVRGVRFGEVEAVAREGARQWLIDLPEELAGRAWQHWKAQVAARPRRTGRKGHGDDWYAMIASRYVQLLDAGVRAPQKALADELDRNRAATANIIAEARRRGLLTPTLRGKAGGVLTDKARALLAGEGQL